MLTGVLELWLLVVGIPFASTTECRSVALPSLTALGQVGVAAATSHWWLRNEPPKAPWKKSSAIAYGGWCLACRYL